MAKYPVKSTSSPRLLSPQGEEKLAQIRPLNPLMISIQVFKTTLIKVIVKKKGNENMGNDSGTESHCIFVQK